MRFYSAKLRLAGSPLHEVLKENLSAPEVLVLRHVHGEDAVLDLKQTDDRPVSNQAERQRLEQEYPPTTDENGEVRHILPALFGALYAPLPTSLPDVTEIAEPPAAEARVDAGSLAELSA